MLRAPAVPPSTSPVRAVAAFLAAGLLVLSLVAGVLAVVQQRSAEREAIRDARVLTEQQARDFAGLYLTDAALQPGPEFRELDAYVRDYILGPQVVRVKIWNRDGIIVYSDDAKLVGQRFQLAADELAAFGPQGKPYAEVSNLDEPENEGDGGHNKLLQVYLGVQTPSGTPLLYETYQPYDRIDEATGKLWAQSVPVLMAGLALLWIAQAPLAWRLATRLRASQEQREQMMLATLAASDRERQRIAADLHDGVVQGLSGASYTLSAAASRAGSRGDTDSADVLHAAAVDLRRSVRELRSLVVTITPPGLRRQPLVTSLHDLAAPLQDRGIHVELDLDDFAVDEARRDLVIRAAQEAVRNVLRHASATAVTVRLMCVDDVVVLEVRDDGGGFVSGAGRRDSMGLSLLGGLAEQEGGQLQVDSVPGSGTRLVLRLPLRRSSVPV